MSWFLLSFSISDVPSWLCFPHNLTPNFSYIKKKKNLKIPTFSSPLPSFPFLSLPFPFLLFFFFLCYKSHTWNIANCFREITLLKSHCNSLCMPVIQGETSTSLVNLRTWHRYTIFCGPLQTKCINLTVWGEKACQTTILLPSIILIKRI